MLQALQREDSYEETVRDLTQRLKDVKELYDYSNKYNLTKLQEQNTTICKKRVLSILNCT